MELLTFKKWEIAFYILAVNIMHLIQTPHYSGANWFDSQQIRRLLEMRSPFDLR